MSWRLSFLVFKCQIDSFPKQVLNDVVPLQLDGVIDGALKLVVDVIMRGTHADQGLESVHMTFSDTVEDACLAVLILAINITPSLN